MLIGMLLKRLCVCICFCVSLSVCAGVSASVLGDQERAALGAELGFGATFLALFRLSTLLGPRD